MKKSALTLCAISFALLSSMSLAANYTEAQLGAKTYRQQTMYSGSPDLAGCATSIPLQQQNIAYETIQDSLNPANNQKSSSGAAAPSVVPVCAKAVTEGQQALNGNAIEPVITVTCSDPSDSTRTGVCTYIAN